MMSTHYNQWFLSLGIYSIVKLNSCKNSYHLRRYLFHGHPDLSMLKPLWSVKINKMWVQQISCISMKSPLIKPPDVLPSTKLQLISNFLQVYIIGWRFPLRFCIRLDPIDVFDMSKTKQNVSWSPRVNTEEPGKHSSQNSVLKLQWVNQQKVESGNSHW